MPNSVGSQKKFESKENQLPKTLGQKSKVKKNGNSWIQSHISYIMNM